MQLKLRHVAEALAHASVDCIYNIIKKLDYKFGTVRKKKKTKRKYYSNIILLYVKITVEASKNTIMKTVNKIRLCIHSSCGAL